MKLKVTINTDTIVDAPWPAEKPVPVPGDSIIMRHNGHMIACTVTDRCFSVGTDPFEPGTPMMHIMITGKSAQDSD
ncbi:hypothetical protein [Pseudomaricurvus alkylphenolicus]|uniref:hypothetical protein n=1 Tax=Pseudomaricurvus alkylphenolicus TaxID=1306991 RepID=UPI00142035D7|nr:hypothetical protein [Pseudomaricurvus alkylphenolicus]